MTRHFGLGLKLGLCIGLTASTLLTLPATAQEYPARPIKMIMPAGAGGTSDAYARAVAREVETALGKPIVVENMAGAGGVIGTRALVRSASDGYTIGWVTNSYISHHLTSKDPQYRWPDDFILVHKGTSVQVGLVVNAKTPFKSVRELIEYAKANPRKLNAANAGNFTQAFMASKLFQNLAGIELTDVAYKTSPDMVRSVFAGETDLVFTPPGLYEPGVAAGTIRPLALLNEKRYPAMPRIPTMIENGVNMTYYSFQGFVFPKGTPIPIVDRWHREIEKANQSAVIRKMIEVQSLIEEKGSRDEMVRQVNQDVAVFEKLMKDAKLTPE